MTMTMQETDVFLKPNVDSESLTFSDSCVRSDIADIIKRIYSPRPITHINMSMEHMETCAAELRETVGDNPTISKPKEKKGKRFGFYFEPVTKDFAKTLVDSSTTSGSVSLPIFRYKPKRLRHVCDCCKRKIPYRDHELRTKRTRWNSGLCRQSEYFDVGECSTLTSLGLGEKHSRKVKVSSSGMVKIPSSSFKMLDEIQASSMNLTRNPSSKTFTKYQGDLLNKEKSKVLFNSGPILNLQVDPNPNSKMAIGKTQQTSSRGSKKREVSSSLFQRIVHKTYNLDCVRKMFPQSSSNIEKATKQKRNQELSIKLEKAKAKSCDVFENLKKNRTSRNQTKGEMIESKTNLEKAQVFEKCLTSDDDTNLEKVIIHSCQEQISRTTYHDNAKSTTSNDEIENVQNLKTCGPDFYKVRDIRLNNLENEQGSEKYQVAYRSLKIERDTNWSFEFWAGIFGAFHSIASFFIAFFLHLLTFVLQSLIQPVLFGTVRISSDHLFKPCLSTVFDSVIQPMCSLIEKFADSLRDVCLPVSQCFGVYCKEVSHICRACRVVEIHKNYHFNEELQNH